VGDTSTLRAVDTGLKYQRPSSATLAAAALHKHAHGYGQGHT